jgi:hypothetical protein
MHKLSITVDDDVARALEILEPRSVSRFVNTAIKHELERARVRALLSHLEEVLGPPDSAMMREAARDFENASSAARTRAAKRTRTKRR